MKRLLRIAALFSVTLLWWGEKGYAAGDGRSRERNGFRDC